MSRYILFIQGGGNGGYEADKALAASLQTAAGKAYHVAYPEITADEAAPDFGWLQQIGKHMAEMPNDSIVVAHSFGASMVLKYFAEHTVAKKIAGLFLIATPFWEGTEDWKAGLKLPATFADTLPRVVPIFFYHCKDDAEVPVQQLDAYKKKFPQATFRVLQSGGHQLNNNLTVVADDITSL